MAAFVFVVVTMAVFLSNVLSKDEDDEKRTQHQPKELRELRKCTHNTLELVAVTLADSYVHAVNKAVCVVFGPYMEAHSVENKACRSCEESAKWLAEEAGGRAFFTLRATVVQLGDSGLLQEAGLARGGCLLGCQTKQLESNHPAIIEQDRLASVVGCLSMNLVRFGLNTAIMYMRCYPAAFFEVLLPNRAEAALNRMREVKDLHERHLKGSNVPFWVRSFKRNLFRDKFVVKVGLQT